MAELPVVAEVAGRVVLHQRRAASAFTGVVALRCWRAAIPNRTVLRLGPAPAFVAIHKTAALREHGDQCGGAMKAPRGQPTNHPIGEVWG